jgi:hypothetical protein
MHDDFDITEEDEDDILADFDWGTMVGDTDKQERGRANVMAGGAREIQGAGEMRQSEREMRQSERSESTSPTLTFTQSK